MFLFVTIWMRTLAACWSSGGRCAGSGTWDFNECFIIVYDKQRYNNAKVDYDAKWQNWWVMGGIEMMSNCILAKLRMKTYYNNYPPNQREILMAFHLVIVVPSSPGGSPRLFSSIPLLMFRQFKFAHKLNSDPWINHLMAVISKFCLMRKLKVGCDAKW